MIASGFVVVISFSFFGTILMKIKLAGVLRSLSFSLLLCGMFKSKPFAHILEGVKVNKRQRINASGSLLASGSWSSFGGGKVARGLLVGQLLREPHTHHTLPPKRPRRGVVAAWPAKEIPSLAPRANRNTLCVTS